MGSEVDHCTLGIENKTKITDLERRMDGCELAQKDTRTDIAKLRDDLTKRPQWVVLIVITILMSISTGLIVRAVL